MMMLLLLFGIVGRVRVVRVGVVGVVRVGVRGEVERELERGLGHGCGEARRGGGGNSLGLGRAGEGEALERGRFGVDVHLGRVGGPERAKGRARAAAVGVRVGVRVGRVVRVRGRAGEREEGVVVREEVGLGDGQLEVEAVEELTLDAANVALAEDSRAERSMDVLEGGVIQVLQEDDKTR